MRRLLVSAALAAALLVSGAPQAWAAPPDPAPDAGWSVTDGQLTWKSDRRIPMGDAAVEFYAGDRLLGRPQAAPDDRTFRLPLEGADQLKDLQVRAGGRRLDAAAPAPARKRAAVAPAPQALPPAQVDPGVKGPYKTVTGEYTLAGVRLPELPEPVEMQGVVVAPQGAPGPRPLALFLHGRHYTCFDGADENKLTGDWPCAEGSEPVPSHRGYLQAQELLAAQGYVTVSIAANGINAQDGWIDDRGAQARSSLVRQHLARWADWAGAGRASAPAIVASAPKADLSQVFLMGHSRGGEGVSRAAMDSLTPPPAAQDGYRGQVRWTIRGLLLIGPTIFGQNPVPDVPSATLLPGCDGDVVDLQGQLFVDATRGVSQGKALHSSLYVVGANHNFFNTEWTPGQSEAPSNDDWYGEDDKESPCGAKYAGRLTAKQQQAVGTAYVAGFFRLQLGHETKFLPQFDGSDSRAASAGRAVVRVVSQAPVASRRDVDALDKALPAGAVTGKASATVCAGVSQPSGRTAATPTCMSSDDWANAPHWGTAWYAARTPTTAVTKLSWTGTDGVLRLNLPAWQRDVRRYAALSFRAAPDPIGTPKIDLSVRVVDGRGRAAVVPVSAVSDALVRMPGRGDSGLPKNLLRTVRIPVGSLKGVDLRDVRAVELRTDRVARGSAYVSDVAFSSPGVGLSAPARLLPRLSASSVTVKEGDKGTKSMDFSVTLSRPSIRPVSVYVETNGDLGTAVGDVTRQLVFKPGQVRQKVSVPVVGNIRDSYDVPFSLVLSAPREGLLNQSFGHGLVIDDDATPTVTIGNVTVGEKGGTLRFPVKLSAPSDKMVNISGVLKDGTAVIRKDYLSEYDDGTDPPERGIDGYVEPGKTAGDLAVRIVDDKLKEPVETFTVDVQSVDGANIKLPVTAKATITDND